MQRFRREADAAARLNNPHVIPIHHYGEIDGRLYVDMRLIEGRDLQQVLADGPLEPARAVRIIEQVAKALHAAHKIGLVHRDVKPSNILLDEDDFAYLIDFGIARAADETRVDQYRQRIGTLPYMAPERFGTRAEDDARADIYALACVLYECLTGQPAVPGDTMAQPGRRPLNTPPPRPSSTEPNVPAQVDEVIATGMAKDPDQRYATTVELADAARDAITAPLAPRHRHPPCSPTRTRPAPGPPDATIRLPTDPPHPRRRRLADCQHPDRSPRPDNAHPAGSLRRNADRDPAAHAARLRRRRRRASSLTWPPSARSSSTWPPSASSATIGLGTEPAYGPQVVLPFTGLNDPDGVAVDSAGNVYVTDTGNNRVLKLAAGSATQDVLPFTGLNALPRCGGGQPPATSTSPTAATTGC